MSTNRSMTKTSTFVLRLHNTEDDTFAVGAMDLPAGTSLESATEIVIGELEPGYLLEQITNSTTKESASLKSIARAPRGFGA